MKNLKNIVAIAAVIFAINTNAQDKKIESSELPRDAVTFLDTHFKTIAVDYANLDQDAGKKSYEVRLSDGTELEFTDAGEWKEVDGKKKEIPTAYIPAEILNYISNKYPKEVITQIDKNKEGIEVELSNGVELEFDSNGKFMRIDK